MTEKNVTLHIFCGSIYVFSDLEFINIHKEKFIRSMKSHNGFVDVYVRLRDTSCDALATCADNAESRIATEATLMDGLL